MNQQVPLLRPLLNSKADSMCPQMAPQSNQTSTIQNVKERERKPREESHACIVFDIDHLSAYLRQVSIKSESESERGTVPIVTRLDSSSRANGTSMIGC